MFEVLMAVGKITEGMAAINTPCYFLSGGPCPIMAQHLLIQHL
jgi:hypothetical protein